MKKLRNVIEDARKQGHKVVVRREKDGSSKTKEILVIKAWNSLSQGEFRNKTLSDIDAERA